MDLKALLAKHVAGGSKDSSDSSDDDSEDSGGALGPLAKKLGVSEELLAESLRAFMREESEAGEGDDDGDEPSGKKSLSSLLS